MRPSKLTTVVLTAVFMSLASPSFANPFVSGGVESVAPAVSPVRASRPSERIVVSQLEFRERLASLIGEWKQTGSARAIWGLLAVAFVYGFLHALGPGHRKTIVFSMYVARKAPAGEPALVGVLLATLHGGAAIGVLLAVRGVSGALSTQASSIGIWMEGGSYLVLIVLAGILSAKALCALLSSCPSRSATRMGLGALLVSGAYPCPGAILVLILSLTLDIVPIGMLAVASMSLGMSVPIVAAGYLAWFGRARLFMSLKMEEERIGRLSAGVELMGYLTLLAVSVYVALPFALSLIQLF